MLDSSQLTPADLQNNFSVATLQILRVRCQNFTQLRSNLYDPCAAPYRSLACLRCNPTADHNQGQLLFQMHLPIENITHITINCQILREERAKIGNALEGVMTELRIEPDDWKQIPQHIQTSLILANDPPPHWNLRQKSIILWRKLALPHCAEFALRTQAVLQHT